MYGASLRALANKAAGAASVAREGPAGPDGWAAFRVVAEPGRADLRELIAQTAAKGGLIVRELRRESLGLERLFLDMIEAEGSGGSAAEDGPA